MGGLILTFVLIGFAAAVLSSPPNHAHADASRIVSVYYDGQKRVITTEASTVGEALRVADVTTDPADLVEPARDTVIPQGFFNINVYRARPVIVADGSKTTLVHTAYQSPRLIADQAGVKTFPEDTFDTEVIQDFTSNESVGQKVVIHRSVPVIILADGKQLVVRTQKKTVGQLLDDRDVALGAQDTVSPPRDTPITANLVIQINRVTVVQLKVNEPIAHITQLIKDATVDAGTTKVKAEGQDGAREVTYRVHYINGAEQSRVKLGEQVVSDAVTRIMLVGTKIDYTADPVALGKQMAAARGWVGVQWDSLYSLWSRESGWNPSATNFFSGACGIPQAYPCNKITDHTTAGQIQWGLSYIAGKYGDPASAWAYWQRNHSY